MSNAVDVFTYSYVTNSSLLAGVASAVPSGDAASYAFEPNRIVKTQVLNKWGGTTISQFDYTSDAVGRRTKRVDTLTVTNDFGYNARSELASALMGTNTYGYVYDPIGNRLTATNNAEVLHYGANALNQYTNITDGVTLTPLYDADGNLTNDSVRAYTWDAENRLLSVEPLSPTNGAQRVACAYDYQSRRVTKIAETWNGSAWGSVFTNRFTYDGWNLLIEVRTSGSLVLTNSYTWGLDLSQSLQGAGGIGGLLTASLGGTNVFYYHDGNGNVTELADGSGSIVAHYEYSPFGETTAKTGILADANPYQFSAKYADAETGLLCYGYRYYQVRLSRWLSRDPLGSDGGLNLYALLGNQAVSSQDPLGLCCSIKEFKVKSLGWSGAWPSLPFGKRYTWHRDIEFQLVLDQNGKREDCRISQLKKGVVQYGGATHGDFPDWVWDGSQSWWDGLAWSISEASWSGQTATFKDHPGLYSLKKNEFPILFNIAFRTQVREKSTGSVIKEIGWSVLIAYTNPDDGFYYPLP